MARQYKTSYKAYSAWNYEKEIEDLNAASEQGWQLVKGGCFHSRFVKNPDVRYRYQIDYCSPDDMGRYIETFREQGWEYVNSTFNGWNYFRKLWDPALPEEEYEIFTDRESLKEMNGRWVRFALGLGIVLGLFTVIWIIRMILTPQLPILAQLIVYAAIAVMLLRGALIMRNPDSSKSRRGDGRLLAVYLLIVVLGTAATVWLGVARPYFNTDTISESLSEPMVDNRAIDFDVKYKDNYYIDLKIDAKAPFTFSIVDEAGEKVFTTTAEHYEESGIKQKLSKGHYWLSMSCDDGYDMEFSIE
jgi:hypothetical protein